MGDGDLDWKASWEMNLSRGRTHWTAARAPAGPGWSRGSGWELGEVRVGAVGAAGPRVAAVDAVQAAAGAAGQMAR